MRIYSNFRDYYDIGLKYSIDEEPMYIRNEVHQSEGKTYDILKLEQHHIGYGMVYFLGGYYPFVQFEPPDSYGSGHCLYSLEEIIDFHKNSLKDKCFKEWESSKKSGKFRDFSTMEDYQGILDPNYKRKWSDRTKFTDMVEAIDSHRIGDTPIMVYHADFLGRISVTSDSWIGKYEFYKVIEAYTAFHTLETHLSNIARPENPIVTISDKDLAVSKGYNKWSFRKMGKNSK